jgi:hypothetical protein
VNAAPNALTECQRARRERRHTELAAGPQRSRIAERRGRTARPDGEHLARAVLALNVVAIVRLPQGEPHCGERARMGEQIASRSAQIARPFTKLCWLGTAGVEFRDAIAEHLWLIGPRCFRLGCC